MRHSTTLLVGVVASAAAACSADVGEEARAAPKRDGFATLGAAKQRVTVAERLVACDSDARVALGLVSREVCAGADVFFRESFDGNGRQCGTCHRAEDNFTISPEFIGDLPSNDPLFVAETNPALANLERAALLRDFAMVVENADGFEDPNVKFTLRSIPHTLSMATSINPLASNNSSIPAAAGWSGDGAPVNPSVLGADGSLRAFLAGAIIQHYPNDLSRTPGLSFRLATDPELDVTEAFQLSLGRTSELDLSAVSLTDGAAESGRVSFINSGCNGCHSNAGANIAAGFNLNFDTGVEALRLPAVDAAGIPADGGHGSAGTLQNGFGNGAFNTTPLIEAADTGPFFHTNAFDTIEDAVEFYQLSAFTDTGRPAIFANDPQTVENVGRFLRVLNISLNLQMAVQRLEAAQQVLGAFGTGASAEANDMLELAAFELEDAHQVASTAPTPIYSPAQRALLNNARVRAQAAANANGLNGKLNQLQNSLTGALQLQAILGTGLNMTLGEGNLMR